MDEKWWTPFLDGTKQVLQMMADVQIYSTSVTPLNSGDLLSYGVSSVITFAGEQAAEVQGRLIIDFPPDVALKIAGNLLGEPQSDVHDPMMLAAISEINNTIAGDAVTTLNNRHQFGLRLAPPIVLTGEKVVFTSVKVRSISVMCKCNVGFFRFYVTLRGVE